MRIALVCRPFSFHGGVETATSGLLGELVRQGESVDLITAGGLPPPVPGVRVRRVPVVPAPSLARLLSFALGARRVARGHPYDIVQSHERVLLQDVYRAGEGTHRGYLTAMGRSGRGPYDRAVLWLERRIFGLRAARHVVAIARRGDAEIRALYGTSAERVSVVYNGVDLERFRPAGAAAARAEARASLGLPGSAWVVLFVGSGFERKGLGPLVEAMAGLRDRSARLVVAGRGRREAFRALAARIGVDDRVLWLGPRPDVDRLYSVADAVALPARYEPFGNVVLEALASGLPVLTSRAAGAGELICRGVNGWVVEQPTPQAVAEGLEALRDTDPTSLRAEARRSAEPYTYAAQLAALRAVYRRL